MLQVGHLKIFGARMLRRRQNLFLLIAGIFLSILAIINIFPYMIIDFGYLTRPIWDHGQVRFENVIVNHYSDRMSIKERCKAHGWTLRDDYSTPSAPKIYDAVIFSVELDMMEIRIRELWDVVDKFVVLESNATFTGLPKDEVFKKNMDRFDFAKSKIIYKSLPLYPLKTGESAWINEGRMRDGMTDFLGEIGIQPGDLFTSSDVDEIISQDTVELVKSCQGVPDSLHLQMNTYLYSYEFPTNDGGIWQTSIHKWRPGHSRRLGSIPKSNSAKGLPYWVLENSEKFKFLLPGGCKRGGKL
ncbi:hypothetical protein BGZ76_004021 [Entomortierella beljakovae]|nr:hypothetical protein BGZ76_004021 [Entomortierella beljakovae]